MVLLSKVFLKPNISIPGTQKTISGTKQQNKTLQACNLIMYRQKLMHIIFKYMFQVEVF